MVTITNSRNVNGVVVDDAAGSGIVWDARGYIVTNYHCIQGPLRDSSGAEVPHHLPQPQRLACLVPF